MDYPFKKTSNSLVFIGSAHYLYRCALLLCFLSLTLLCPSCGGPTKRINPYSDFGTQNDSARYYFHKGWREIMDYGRWTRSEVAFRKAMALDPDWLLGKSMVARITKNLAERQQLLLELEGAKHGVDGDERTLLDVNILSHIAANNRDLGIANGKEFNEKRWALAEKNFGAFARKYPEDNYFKAEYIEFLHLNHGAQTALDSLYELVTRDQRKLGFYLGYEAALKLEIGHLEEAIRLAHIMDSQLKDSSYNSPLMLKAQIYQAQDSLQQALDVLNRIIAKDSNHLIAIGTKRLVQQHLKDN